MKRIPRIKGLTILSLSLKEETDPTQIKEKTKAIKYHILNQYFLNNQRLNGEELNLEQIAKHLQLTYIEVLKYMNDSMGFMQGLVIDDQGQIQEDSSIQEALRALKNLIFLGSLNHSQIADNQLRTMLKAQGDRYQAFVSAEVNSAMRNVFAADANLREAYRTLAGPSTPNGAPYNQQNNFYIQGRGPKQEGQKTLTVSEAQRLLDESPEPKLLSDPEHSAALYSTYKLEEMDEVRANYQKGDHLSGEQDPITDAQATIVDSTIQKKDKLARHLKRREKEEGFDPDDDDNL